VSAPPGPELWVLGNLTIDDLVFWDGTTSMGLCGGNAVFAALGARLWSAGVGLAARVGPDYPPQHLRALASAGIRLALSRVEAPSIHDWGLYETPDRRQFVNRLDSGSHLDQSLLPPELPPAARAARVCHIAPMPLVVQAQLVRALAAAGVLVSLDPHESYIARAEDALLELLGHVGLFLPSRREAALLFGRDAPEEAARAFAACGPRVVAIKLGAQGSLLCEAGQSRVRHVPAVPVDAVDPTGAGDAYCGGFGLAYGRGGDALRAACCATVSASFVVEQRGALAVLPLDRDLAERRLAQLIEATGCVAAAGRDV
jgi:ribokinase